MPILNIDDSKLKEYHPNWVFKNGHLNTIYPFLFRKKISPYFIRQRITTTDDDFIDLDCILNQNQRLVIICHGLEGSSQSQYILSAASILSNNGYDVIAINFRSCSEEMNNNLRMYHSGETTDLDFIINENKSDYKEIHLLGFSLGGNVVLKYLGEQSSKLLPMIISAAAISTPCRLDVGAQQIIRFKNRLYQKKFMDSLIKKIKIKHRQFPHEVKIKNLSKVKNLIDIDEYFTSRLHGFDGAFDYYNKCSSRQFIPSIRIPTLILTAKDDPFLDKDCYPIEEAQEMQNIFLLTPNYGGHVGFVTNNSDYYWSDKTILKFFNNTLI